MEHTTQRSGPARDWRRLQMSSAVFESSPDVGSSRRRTLGSVWVDGLI